jgi:tetratricopeptide (TPR) repeat protein
MRFPLTERTILVLFAWAVQVVLYAQSLEQWMRWGDAAMERQQYYGATRFYDGALAIEPGRMSLQWKQAEACRLAHQYERAAAFYDRVYRKDQGRTYPQALRWLAEMRSSSGDVMASKEAWAKVLERTPTNERVIRERAVNALEGIERYIEDSTVIPGVELVHEAVPLNSYDSEFSPRFGPDSALYFSSLRGATTSDEEVEDTIGYRTRIHRSTGGPGNWSTPVEMVVDAAGHTANPTWSLDGEHVFFTFCPDGGMCRIHRSAIDEDPLHPVAIDGLGDALSTQPMLVEWEGREMLLFVSDRPGGKGGTDIWQARIENGRAVEVFPVNGAVNTAGNERCPWFDTTTSTLWFSSDHLPGLGGYDVFTSTLVDDVFAIPVNVGMPINSPANDLYPMIDRIRQQGWITSNRKGSLAAKGSTCCNDLYRWDLLRSAPDSVTVTKVDPASTLEGIPAGLVQVQRKFPLRLYFHNDEPDARSWSTSTDHAYLDTYRAYKSLMPAYLQNNADGGSMTRFFNEEVDRGAEVLEELTNALVHALGSGKSVTLDVRGHASPLARNDYNINLSKRRIQSLRNHLREALNGRLSPYLDGSAPNHAVLTVHELPFGEDQAGTGVSDDLRDTDRSVYSVDAARERRIEVVAFDLVEERQDSTGTVRLIKDLGDIKQDQERNIAFLIRNTSGTPVRLMESTADCGCTTADLPKESIPTDAARTVDVHFSGRAPLGRLKRTVSIVTDGSPQRYELIILGTVVP